MKSNYFILIAFLFALACSSKKVEISSDKKVSVETAQIKPIDVPTKFGLSEDIISKIDNEMGLGKLLPWENDADPGDKPSYFTTLEYEVKSAKESQINYNNVIELSIGSEGPTGRYVDFIRMTVGIMNPEDKSNAKSLFLKKVNQLSKVLSIKIPSKIGDAIAKEQNTKVTDGQYEFEIEVYGVKNNWMTLHIR